MRAQLGPHPQLDRRVGTFNPKPNYQPMTDVVKLGKDKYDHALVMRNIQLTDKNVSQNSNSTS